MTNKLFRPFVALMAGSILLAACATPAAHRCCTRRTRRSYRSTCSGCCSDRGPQGRSKVVPDSRC